MIAGASLRYSISSLFCFCVCSGREYLHLSVRGLYQHVLSAITNPLTNTKDPAVVPARSVRRGVSDSVVPSSILMSNATTESSEGDKQVTFQPPPSNTTGIQSRSASPIPEYGGDDVAGLGEHTYRERLGGYLHPRDMRRLVTPFSASNEPELIVRRHVMLFNFDPLRAVILRDRLLVLVPEGADSLLINLEERVRGGIAEVEKSFFGAPSEPPSETHSVRTETEDLNKSIEEESESIADTSQSNKKDRTTTTGKKLLGRKHATEDNSVLDVSGHTAGKHSIVHASKVVADTTKNVLSSLKKTIIANKESNNFSSEDSIGGDDIIFEWEEMNAKEWVELPFELQCADAVLFVVASLLTDDTYELQDEAMDYITRVVVDGQYGLSDDPLAGIRHTKDAIREMRSRVKGFVQSMNRILDDDEDMALMNLSRLLSHPERFIKPVDPAILDEEADEPELILEAHLQIALTLSNELELIEGQVNTASELIDQQLDSVRNRILFANMIISVFSLCVATASLVGSLFGMNVPNSLEDSYSAFTVITTSTILSCVALMLIIMGSLIYTGTIPMPGLSGNSSAE